MKLKILPDTFTVCRVAKVTDIDMNPDIYFIGKTDEELSLVCRTEDVPKNTLERDDGWRGSFKRIKKRSLKLLKLLVKDHPFDVQRPG